MSLRTLAETDLGGILEDAVTGFGWDIQLTSPEGLTVPMVGFSQDISQVIDAQTGQLVNGALASIALRISSLITAGLAVPRGVADKNSKPWVVRFNDLLLNPYVFKVRQSNPDRMLGLVTCILEVYKP